MTDNNIPPGSAADPERRNHECVRVRFHCPICNESRYVIRFGGSCIECDYVLTDAEIDAASCACDEVDEDDE